MPARTSDGRRAIISNGAHGRDDPTINVGNLVEAEGKFQDGMREAQEKLFDAKLAATNLLFRSMLDAETKRHKDLADMRVMYETRIAEMLKTSVESTSSLVSQQLLGIQGTLNDRVAKLEQFRWESGGKSSVADPALTEVLSQMAASIGQLKATGNQTQGRSMGRGDILTYIFSTVGSIGAVVAIIVAISKMGGGP